MNEVAAIIADLIKAGVAPELIGRVAAVITDVVKPTQARSGAALRQAAYRERLGIGYDEWLSIRSLVLEVYEPVCVYCGIAKAKVVDHVIPRSKGGANDLSNLVPSCHRCNSLKRDKDLKEFLRCQ
jgi:5-methylcytosine-specific restriction endonuclease McrA